MRRVGRAILALLVSGALSYLVWRAASAAMLALLFALASPASGPCDAPPPSSPSRASPVAVTGLA